MNADEILLQAIRAAVIADVVHRARYAPVHACTPAGEEQ